MPITRSYLIHSLGDDALLIDFGNIINIELNQYIVGLAEAIRQRSLTGVKEVSVAYASLAVYYDITLSRVKNGSFKNNLQNEIERIITDFQPNEKEAAKKIIDIPVCYDEEYAPDLNKLSEEKNISIKQVVELHCSNIYHVYMIGFLPGFAYMGKVDERICMDRKPEPVPILQGSVGIAGNQTGIYPIQSPGGWNIIGRTPVQLFQPDHATPCFLKAGDKVRFYPISHHEFNSY